MITENGLHLVLILLKNVLPGCFFPSKNSDRTIAGQSTSVADGSLSSFGTTQGECDSG
jgi:hypothetical protein